MNETVDARRDDYVVVLVSGKGKAWKYIARIDDIVADDEYEGGFLSKVYAKIKPGDKPEAPPFVINEEDNASFSQEAIVFKLPVPIAVGGSARRSICFLFYLPFLSSIHEKANCIAILWTGSPHSLGSCRFRGIWATCLPHKGGASRKVPCPRTQQANLPACSPQPPLNAERQAGKLRMSFFKVFWYDSTRGMNPWFTDCEADALTTTSSRR